MSESKRTAVQAYKRHTAVALAWLLEAGGIDPHQTLYVKEYQNLAVDVARKRRRMPEDIKSSLRSAISGRNYVSVTWYLTNEELMQSDLDHMGFTSILQDILDLFSTF